MKEASRAVLVVGMGVAIARLLVHREALRIRPMRFRELGPEEKWELGGRNQYPWRIFEREENPS